MLQEQLIDLRDFILTHNSYFNKGYYDGILDKTTGKVNYFPADFDGDYFYLRLPDNLTPDYSNDYIISPNGSIGIRYNLILVAAVNNGDSSLLLENMISTIAAYGCRQAVTITKMLFMPDEVVLQELAKVKKEVAAAGLKRLGGYALCSVHFNFTLPFTFTKLNCITKPCLPC